MTRQMILIIEDDEDIRELLVYNLEKNGYEAEAVESGETGLASAIRRKPDLILLDLMLPGDDGLALCRKLRADSDMPVIMLTARGEETDRIVGLEIGADDYLAKPFSPRELLARIKSVLRRHRSLPRDLRAEEARTMTFAGWRLDTVARHMISPDGVVMSLSGAEFRMLRIFLDHPNHVLSRDQLMMLTHGREAEPFDRSIDNQVSRLRHRLSDDPTDPKIIKTVRGEGYVLAVPVEVKR